MIKYEQVIQGKLNESDFRKKDKLSLPLYHRIYKIHAMHTEVKQSVILSNQFLDGSRDDPRQVKIRIRHVATLPWCQLLYGSL